MNVKRPKLNLIATIVQSKRYFQSTATVCDRPLDAVACGRWIGDIPVLNAAGVGMPFGKPGTCSLLFGSKIKLQRTDCDVARAAAGIRATPYPEASESAADNVLHPPSEKEMLAALLCRSQTRDRRSWLAPKRL
jgi:hypothetical protein